MRVSARQAGREARTHPTAGRAREPSPRSDDVGPGAWSYDPGMAEVPVALGESPRRRRSLPADPRPPTAPDHLHVLAKPTGPICNLDCTYCFFLSKESLYPGDRFRMADDAARAVRASGVEAQNVAGGDDRVAGWRADLHGRGLLPAGGRARRRAPHAGQFAAPHHPDQRDLPHRRVVRAVPRARLLVGVSIDGPRVLHDEYRVDKKGQPTFDKVMPGFDLLRGHDVEVNVLCTVHTANQPPPPRRLSVLSRRPRRAAHPADPDRGTRNDTGFQEGDTVTDRSVDPMRGPCSSPPSSTNG